nr:PREDICTED: protein MNN4-like [Linepithema humile]
MKLAFLSWVTQIRILISALIIETCALQSSFNVASYQIDNSEHQSLKEKENILPLKNPEDNSTDEVLFQEHPRLTVDLTDKANASPNNLPQIVMQNETVTAGCSQFNINEDTTINKAINANVNTTGDIQSVSMSAVVHDNDFLDVPSDIPDVFKKAIFWPRKNNSATKKRVVKVKIPSVATSLAWQEYHREKEMEKCRRQNAIEERKRKRQETAEKKRQETEEKKRQKVLQQAEKAAKKNNSLNRKNKRGK